MNRKENIRINNQIRAREVRVIDTTEEGAPSQVMDTREAITLAESKGLDLIEISPNATPPVAKIMDFGKYKYEEAKKTKEAKKKAHLTETKSLQIKIGTGENDLSLKAKKADQWLQEGHRIKIELYLVGRSKYSEKSFQKERLDRILNLIKEPFKIADPVKPSPKGIMLVIEKDRMKKPGEEITSETA